MRARLVAVLAATAVACFALPGQAAPRPQITDAVGDVLLPSASLDIVSALFGTAGRTSKVGRKTVYTPNQLVVTVTYAAPPMTSEGASQAVLFDLAGCGEVLLQSFAQDGRWATADCLEDPIDFVSSVKGNTMTFGLPFNVIGKQFKAGSTLTKLRTWTGLADPVVGYGPADFSEMAVLDSATTTASYRVS